ncbi:MAG: penicillin-binding protein 1C [Rubrivivax sp.]|nr:penicillin-binding protein 1C [Rubrivivax sp.]
MSLARRVLAALTVALAAAGVHATPLPSFEAVRAAHRPSDVPLLDRHGEPLQWLRVDETVRRGPWVAVEDIAPALRDALVLGEDRRFWDHAGVDWHALAASAWANAWNERTRGASTLTMQLAGLLDEELARPAGGRSVAQKLGQVVRARELEARWSKRQILEAYLNRVPLRGELVGVAAAAQQLFGKQASGLDRVEGAILAAMVRAPNAAAPQLERRACELLQAQALDCGAVGIGVAQALARRPGPAAGEALAPHLARRLAREAGTATNLAALPSTLDAATQRAALAALRRQLAELRGRGVDDGAVLVLDNVSGEVRAWVGSSGPYSAAAAVDAVTARRQPGSALKPFVYAQALQQRLITPASVLDDAPLALAAGTALYRPQNYDLAFRGAVSARVALASSLNVPAVQVAAMLGPDAVFDALNRAGLALRESGGFHGHALALGSAEVTLLDLANAYRMLARGGVLTPPRWRGGDPPVPSAPGVRVFDAAVAYQVADMLADPAARAPTFGFDSPLVTRGWAAVKTGTSKDLRDNWCVGFSDRYTVAVWVGNAAGQPMHGVSGTQGAAPVWRELMLALHDGRPSRAPPAPRGLQHVGGEWFLAGTAPAAAARPRGRDSQARDAARAASQVPPFGIASPRDGTVLLLDPDIPPAAQRLVFEGAPGRWLLDGREIGRGVRVSWLPRPGRFVLERRPLPGAALGEAADRVAFEVRAAALAGPRQTGTGPPNSRSTAASITTPHRL